MEYFIANFCKLKLEDWQKYPLIIFPIYYEFSEMEYFIANFCKFKIGRLAKISFDYFSHIF